MVAVVAAAGATFALGAAPALATTLIQPNPISAYIETGYGALNDFSYTSTHGQMARNLKVYASLWAPNSTVTYSWKDVTTGGGWNAGGSVTNLIGWDSTITGIPRSTCGHLLEVQASGKTGVYGPNGADYSTLYPVTETTQVAMNCGPQVWLSSSGIEGDGFTPSGQVNIQTYSNTATLTSQNATATPNFVKHCTNAPPLGKVCFNAPAPGGGQVDVSNALNQTTDCGQSHAAVGYEGYDDTTGLFDNRSAVCFQ
jgi:hypothetical protein